MQAPERDANAVPGQTVDVAWERLQAQFELSSKFWLGFVFSAAPQAVDALRTKRDTLFESNGLRCRDYLAGDPDTLARSLIWLLTSPESLDFDCVWVEAIRADSPGASEQPWTRAWEQLFLRTNEHRDALRARLRGGLVFAAPTVIMPLVREAAPDLWSVRSIVINVEVAPSMRIRDPMPSLLPAGVDGMLQTDDSALWLATSATSGLLHLPQLPVLSRVHEVSHPPPPEASVLPQISSQPWRSPPPGMPYPARPAASVATSLATRQLFTPADRQFIETVIANGDLVVAESRIRRALAEFGSVDVIEKAFAHHLLARVFQAKRDGIAALRSIEEAIAIHAQATPDLVPVDWYDLARMIAWKNGDSVNAADHSLRAVAQCRRRLRVKEGVDVLRDLTFALKSRGEHERNMNDMAAAIDPFDEAVLVARRLVDLGNEDISDLSRLSECLLCLGDARCHRNDFVGALATFDEAVKVNRRICVLSDSTARALRGLSVSLNRLGHLRQETRDLAGAKQVFDEALAIRRRLFNEKEPQSLRDLASALSRMGLLQFALGDFEVAATALQESISLGRQLKLLVPESNDASYQLAFVLYHLGKVRGQLGRYDEAKRAFEEAIVLANVLLKLPTESANTRLLLQYAEKALAESAGTNWLT